MPRKRFTAAEKAVYVAGADVEYRNGSHWLPAKVIGPVDTDSLGWFYVPVRVTVRTRTIGPETIVHATSDNVRLRIKD
jgi:hypothetical protein